MNKLFSTLLLSFVCIYAFAQNEDALKDTLNLGTDIEEGAFTESLDDLAFKGIESIHADSLRVAAERALKNIPDSIYIDRLQSIESPINFPYNSKVKAYIELYTKRKRDQVSIMLGLSEYYFPIFEAELDAAGLPLELKYLPIIESALNPRAFSRVGASGLWQFMYPTGKQYGLQVNSYVDERRDPIKSTEAAIGYLTDLYAMYNDWYLVIAAYNCGQGNVNKAIRRSGGKRNFWEIYHRLPRETRGYVPAFIAAAYTMNYYEEHLISPQKADIVLETDTIMINSLLHFNQVAAMTNVNVETLRELNPHYRLDVVPSINKNYALKLPVSSVDSFIDKEEFIYSFEREKYFASNKLVEPSNNHYTPSAPKNKTKVYYTVKSGDAVGLIADWYDVRTSDLRYWNNIRRNLIKVGQKLTVYVPNNKFNYYQQINKMSYAQKKNLDGKTVVIASSTKSKTSKSYSGNYEMYTVRRGDNLWTIAKKYPGISNADIMELNGISDASKLSPGQKLKIRPKS